jgi:GAF domain-containing protein
MPPDAAGSSDRQRRHRDWHRPMSDVLQPQDAFAELARITLSEQSLETVMETIALLTKRTIPGASDVSVTLIDGGRPKTVAFTGRLAVDLDERQYERGYGPCLDSVEGGQPIVINDMASDVRWRDWAAEAVDRGAGSSLSIPVPVQREVMAALNIYSTQANAFDEDGVELATTFSAYAGVALANMHLYQAQGQMAEQLQNAMQSRAVIEQAKGILMGERRCDAEHAFNILIKLSQDTNRKLRDVAQALVDQAANTDR